MGDVLPLEYGIGTVASLTGLDAHTIRAWERRYGAVEPGRSDSGRRRYDDHDVERLRLLRAVTEAGHAIGQVARRSDEELRELLSRHAPKTATGRTPGRLRVALFAPELSRQVEANRGLTSWQIVSPIPWNGADPIDGGADVLVTELPELGPEPWRRVEALRSVAPEALVIVVYRFARHAVLSRLARLGCRVVRGPVRLPALEQSIEDWLEADREIPLRSAEPAEDLGADETPARRFSDSQLALLLESPGNIACECPSHLSALVSSTLAFEAYMEECISSSPEDAALHDRLRTGAGRVRAGLEQLLEHLCVEDNIRV